ncbi:hypothetical protein KFE98_18630 [bacterium SCSIO 12741]|nr:hypothetical protein KFE98_18630 [bacterium SCSIO 12741]
MNALFHVPALGRRNSFILKLALFSLLIILSGPGFGQKLSWSEILEDPKREGWNDNLYEGKYYSYHRADGEFTLIRRDLNMKEEARETFTYKHESAPGKFTEPRFRWMGDRLVVFTRFKDKDEETFHLYYQIYDLSTMQTSGPEEFMDIDFIGKFRYEDILVKVSPDATKMAISYFTSPERGKFEREDLTHHLKVYNNEMQELYKADLVEDDREEHIEINYYTDFSWFSDGRILFLKSRWVGTDEDDEVQEDVDEDEITPRLFTLIEFDDKGSPLDHQYLEVGQVYVNDISVLVDENDKVAIAGVYSKIYSSSMGGVFFAKEGGNGKIGEFEFIHLSEDQVFELTPTKQADKIRKKAEKKAAKKGRDVIYELSNMVWRGFIERGDDYVYILEKYRYWQTQSTDANGNTTTTNHYKYGEIMTWSFSKNMELNWMSRIPKSQYTKNDGGSNSSFVYGYTDDKMYYIYHDLEENLKKPKNETITVNTRKKIPLMLAEVDSEGDFDRQVIGTEKDTKLDIRPRSGMHIEGDRIILIARDKLKWTHASYEF